MKIFKSEDKFVRFGNMKVDYSYQRDPEKLRIEKISDNFNENLANPVKVSCRKDGYYYIIDGQHTAYATALNSYRMKSGTNLYKMDNDAMIKCEVYYGMSIDDEAMLFAMQDDNCRGVTMMKKLNAKYIGGDKQISDYKRFVESYGIKCPFKTQGRTKAGTISCHSTGLKIYNKDKEQFGTILTICNECWKTNDNGLRKEIIIGLDKFLDKYKSEYDYNTLVKKLRVISPEEIIRDGKNFSSHGSSGTGFAFVIAKIYNRKMNRRRLDENKLFKK